MGSMCSSGGGETKQTGSVSPNPIALGAYQDILNRAQMVSNTPYQAYGGQMTAGLDPTQQAGINNINASYGMAQPAFQQAMGYASQGANMPNVGGADIQNYMNPYQQMVTDATMANINEADQRQQQQVKGNAAMSGALGGDRQAVAQAELARQQGLARNQTLAGLNSQNYSQALAAAQQQQGAASARAFQGAGLYGQLGAGEQQAQLQGAGAQMGAGQVAQQTEQQRLSALYNQFQQQQAYPYQQLSWLSGIASPIGSQMGQTQTQTTTAPQKDNTAQYAGMALSAAALMFSDERMKENIHKIGETNDGQPIYRYNYKGSPTTQMGLISQEVEKSHPEAVHHINGVGAVDYDAATAGSIRRAYGGRVGYALGGTPYSDVEGYVPAPLQLGARPLQMSMSNPNSQQQQQTDPGMGALGSGVNAMAGQMGGSGLNNLTGGATTNFGYNSSMMPDTFSGNYGSPDQLFPNYGSGMTDAAIGGFGFADGGLVDTVRAIGKGIKAYADGGDVEMPFNDRWAPVAGSLPDIAPQPQPAMAFAAPAAEGPTRDYDAGSWSPQEVAPQAMSDWRSGADLTARDTGAPVSPAVELPPEITAGTSRGASPYAMPSEALGFDRSPMAAERAQVATKELKRTGLFGLLSEEQQAGLLAMGAGMMAHGSTLKGQWLTGVGQGMQEGLKAVGAHRKEQRSADSEARKLMHELRRDDLAERQFKQRQGLEERKLEETIRQRKAPKLTTDERGYPVLIDPLSGQIVGRPDFNAQPGAPPVHTPNTQGAPAPMPAPEPPPNAPKAPATPKPAEVMAKEEDGLPPNAQFVADTSGGVVAPWRQPSILEGMRPADQELVRAIAEGRRQFLPLQRNNRYNQYIMEKVHEYDPQADQTAFARRQRTTNFFAVGTAGGGGQNIAAMNTFGQHAKELNDLADELKMGRFTDWNALKSNLIQRGMGSKEAQDRIGKWQTASKAVADEGAKVFAGSQSALADREAWHKLFDISNPQSVTKAKLQEIVKLIDGRLNSLAAQYNDGMRTNHAPPEFIKPRTREIFDAIRGSKAPPGLEGTSATGVPAPAAAARSAIDQQALDWANANSSDPRAKAIKERLGAP